MTRPRIYLAGPTVFRRDAAAEGARLKALCERHGLEGLFPGDIQPPTRSGFPAAFRITNQCLDMLRQCQAVVADLSPWRGPHVDDGTAFELGFAHALGLPMFGYCSDMRPLVERIPALVAQGGRRWDESGQLVEDIGLPFNAMISGTLAMCHGTAAAAIQHAADDLAGRTP